MTTLILTSRDDLELFQADGGGKAANLARVTQQGFPVPAWFCLSARAFDAFVNQHRLHDRLAPTADLDDFARQVEELFLSRALPAQVEEGLFAAIGSMNLQDAFLAVRSSGIDGRDNRHRPAAFGDERCLARLPHFPDHLACVTREATHRNGPGHLSALRLRT